MEWAAFYNITDSASNPEVTKWDSAEVAQHKLNRTARTKLAARR